MNEKNTEKGFMFDTTVFNDVLDGQIEIEPFGKFALYTTHVQNDELTATKDAERREELMRIFKMVSPEKIATASAYWGVSRWNECEWPKGSLCEKIKSRLDAREKKANNIQDSLIAVTAIQKGLTLVTDDEDLGKTVIELNGKSIKLKEFLDLMKEGVKP